MAFARRRSQIVPLPFIPDIGAETASEQKGAHRSKRPLTAPNLGAMEAGKSSPLGAGMNSGVAPGMRAGIRANGANEARLRAGIAPLFGRQSLSLCFPAGARH